MSTPHSYVIRPREVLVVVAATGSEHAALDTAMTGASRLQADPGAPAVVAELGNFRAEHDRLTALETTRVERAALGTRRAIDAYRTGDETMAETFTRSSAVLSGDLSDAPQPGGDPLPPGTPLPDVLQGD